ncbi:uncharacterized protein LOC131954191 [Physella acuta]|uniref:uncharacterized protein LOC131954191 n=1 Tax=Physella acuta TaxID=109671 RepID=UPI0027DB2653|nr:uncharacterized protein LOC131954191 [Physella acuta]
MDQPTGNGYHQSMQTPTDRHITRSISGESNRYAKMRQMHGKSSADSGTGVSLSCDIEPESISNGQHNSNAADIGANEARRLQCRQPSANGPDSGLAESPGGEPERFNFPPGNYPFRHSNSEPTNHWPGHNHQHGIGSRQTEQSSRSVDLPCASSTLLKESFEGRVCSGDSFQSHSTSASLNRLHRQKPVDQWDESFDLPPAQFSVPSSATSSMFLSNGSVSHNSPCFSLPSPPAVPKSSLDQVTMELIRAKLTIEQLNAEREIKEKHHQQQVNRLHEENKCLQEKVTQLKKENDELKKEKEEIENWMEETRDLDSDYQQERQPQPLMHHSDDETVPKQPISPEQNVSDTEMNIHHKI